MRKKRHKPEEIVAKLRQVDVLTAQGKSVADAVGRTSSAVSRSAIRSSSPPALAERPTIN